MYIQAIWVYEHRKWPKYKRSIKLKIVVTIAQFYEIVSNILNSTDCHSCINICTNIH